MIQPLKSSRLTWVLDWVDLNEPVAWGDLYLLPTCLFAVSEAGPQVVGQEILRELDQRRAESFLSRLFNEFGTPDQVVIAPSREWDATAWATFGRSYRCRIKVVDGDDTAMSPLLALTGKLKSQAVRALLGREESAPGATDREIAAGLLRTAQNVRSPERKKALLEKAVEIDETFSEAVLALADYEFQTGVLKDAVKLYDRAASLEGPRWNAGAEWWRDYETRAYLRALFGRVLALWHQGELPPAIADAEKLLELNPKDNQGVRFLLPMLHLLADQIPQAVQFFSSYTGKYPRDFAEPGFLFGWGLALTLADDESAAFEKYRGGMVRNLYIAPLLLDLPDPPFNIWHANDRAEPSYANEFIDSFGVLWERDPVAVRTLRECHDRLADMLGRLVDLRGRMSDFQDQRYEPDHDKHWQLLLKEEESITRTE